MASVKIILEKGETIDVVEERLYKALNTKRQHDPTESWEDPAMQDLQAKVFREHEVMYQKMLTEIQEVLTSEYSEW